MKPEIKIRLRQMIRSNILENSCVRREEFAEEIARRWSRL